MWGLGIGRLGEWRWCCDLGGLKRSRCPGLSHGAALRLKDGVAMRIFEPRMETNGEGTVEGRMALG